MFGKKNRFSFKSGVPKNSFQTPFFVIKYDRQAETGPLLAIVISKKIDKRATVRNRIKRFIANQLEEMELDANLRLVLYAKKSANLENLDILKKELIIFKERLK